MSDMRDSTFDNSPFINQPIREDVVIVDDGGLGDFHINNEAEEDGARRSKLFAGIAVAAVFGIGAAFAVSQYIKDQPVVADQSLPSPSAPSKTAAMPPPAAPEAEATSPPAAPDVVRPAPVTRQAARAPKMTPAPSSSSTASMPLTPEQQYTAPAVTPAPIPATVPEPVSPTPPASVQAGNPAINQQSAEPPAAPEAAPAQPEAAPADAPAQ